MKVACDGSSLEVTDEGRGNALVLLHAFALTGSIWGAQAESLARQARVVRVDLRGMGASSAPGGPYLTESLAGDVVCVLDALGVETATVVGHSYSVGIAFEFYRMFPERVAGLGLVGGNAAATGPDTAAEYRAVADAIERNGMGAVLEAFGPLYVGSTTHRNRPDIYQRVTEHVMATAPIGAAATLRGMALRGDSQDLLADIGVPVAVVAGSEDELAQSEPLRLMADAMPNATFEALRCGHVPSLELPERTTAILERLLRRVAAIEPARQA